MVEISAFTNVGLEHSQTEGALDPVKGIKVSNTLSEGLHPLHTTTEGLSMYYNDSEFWGQNVGRVKED